MFWKKRHEVIERIRVYLQAMDQCADLFRHAFLLYITEGVTPEYARMADEVDRLESACDTARRSLEEVMYARALIPESRADILHLIELLDKVPNRCERLVYDALILQVRIPDTYQLSFKTMVEQNYTAARTISEAVHALFSNRNAIRELADQVDKVETCSDILRRDLIRAVFANPDIPGDQRILLRDLAHGLSHISDACENVGDWLNVIVVKRLV